MFVLGWHAPAAEGIRQLQASGVTPITVEGVLRSAGARQLGEILPTVDIRNTSGAFHFQAQPANGFTCFYRKRPGETSPAYPDCPNIPAVMERHAQLLVDAGVDFVLIDSTNLPVRDAFSDTIELRPFEVMAEEWAALRARGIRTPDIATWVAIPTGGNIWADFLNVYNNPAFDRLIMRDRATGKKVFFYVDPPDVPRHPDPAILAAVQSNGGRNDIVTVPMWAFVDSTGGPPDARGGWWFLAPCRAGGQYPTTLTDAPCDQPYTPSSALGSSITVSPAYQTYFASAPFGSTGKAGGLTLRKQFEKALALQPDYLFISSWNEHIAQDYPMDGAIQSMGLETDPSAGNLGFVDSFGINYTRDIEPTVEEGSATYDLLRSCLRVYRAGDTTCSNASEACCQGGNFSANYVYAWSVMYGDNTDPGTGHVVVTSQPEVDAFTSQGWRQICARAAGAGVFCMDPNEVERSGPFVLYAQGGANRVPLYRCELEARHYFLTSDPNCEILGTPGALLGFMSTIKGGETLRALQRCYNETFRHSHTLSGACTASNLEAGVLGYVR